MALPLNETSALYCAESHLNGRHACGLFAVVKKEEKEIQASVLFSLPGPTVFLLPKRT